MMINQTGKLENGSSINDFATNTLGRYPNFPKNLQLRKKFLWGEILESRLPSRKFSHIPPNGKFGKSSTSKWTLKKGICDRSQEGSLALKTPVTSRLVTKYLDDEDQHVRRTALEAAVRLSLPPPPHEDMTTEDFESVERVGNCHMVFLLCVFFFEIIRKMVTDIQGIYTHISYIIHIFTCADRCYTATFS